MLSWLESYCWNFVTQLFRFDSKTFLAPEDNLQNASSTSSLPPLAIGERIGGTKKQRDET
jgi:hypothetical protein